MKIPNQPPTDEEIYRLAFEKYSSEDAAKVFDTFKPYLEIVNGEYLHWDEIQIDSRFKTVDIKLLWGLAKLARNANIRLIKLNGMKLQYFQTPHIEKLLHDLDRRVSGNFSYEEYLGKNLKKRYLVNSLMEEAIASSQLEGAATTRIAAKRMLIENRKPRNKSEQMILNNYSTMMHIKEHAKQEQKLTADLIKDIHKKITKDTLERKGYEGRIRTDNEVVVVSSIDGQIAYTPPDYKSIEELLNQLCNLINNDESNKYYLHPFIKAIILHYMIEYIHAFYDGNGRTARALFYWYLITQNYDYFEYIAVSTAIRNAPAQYARAYLYSEKDSDDVTYFVKFNLHELDIAVTSFERYVDKTKVWNKKIFKVIHQNRELNFRQADMLIDLSKNERPLTIAAIQKGYGITYQTARTDLLKLVKYGYLHYFVNGKQFIFTLNKDKMFEQEP